MHVTEILSRAHAALDVSEKAYAPLCQHRLAQQANRSELMHGDILSPSIMPLTTYLPYHAAQPVAAYTQGARRAGYLASAQWGASVAVSLVRTDMPAMGLYYHGYLKKHLSATDAAAARARRQEGQDIEPQNVWQQIKPYAPLLPFALSGLECVLGTGMQQTPPPARGAPAAPVQLVWWEQMRRVGVMGHIERALLAHAAQAQHRGQAKQQACLLGVAVALRAALLPLRLAAAALLASTAVFGASVGIAYEAGAQAAFAIRVRHTRRAGQAPNIVSMQRAQQQQQDYMLLQALGWDDTVLSAPMIESLWRQHTAAPAWLVGNNNLWTTAGIGASLTYRAMHGNRLGMLPDVVDVANLQRGFQLFYNTARAGFRGYQARPGAAPEAAQNYARGVDVHATGRDANVRRCVAFLRGRFANVDTEANLRALRAFVQAQRHQRTPLAQRRHASGLPLLAAAACVLDGTDNAQQRAQFGFPHITSANHSIRLDDGTAVPVADICAIVWHSLGTLRDTRGPMQTEALQQERRGAFVAALADAMNGHGTILCGPGQVQRMVLVLQGFMDGVAIENYDDAPPVAQYVTYAFARLQAELGEEPRPEAVRRAFDTAWAAGVVRYAGNSALAVAQRNELAAQFTTLAEMTYDCAWAPRQAA